MKRITMILLAAVLVLMLAGCQCSHEWVEADCLTPKTCSKCQETEGEALGHSWTDATCAAPKTCENCGLTEGEALAHTWTEVTCAAPKTCSGCGLTEGEALEHTWEEAHYQAPKTCTVCGTTEGEPRKAAFEENGFALDDIAVGTPVTVAFQEGVELAICVTDYQVFESNAKHEAKEGYEWRSVTYTVTAPEAYHGKTTQLTYSDYNNYYEMENFFASMAQVPGNGLLSLEHTVNHLGEDCRILFQLDESHLDNTGKWVLRETLSFRVPSGFDGMVLCIGDAAKMAGNYADVYMDMYMDENTVFFRLK